LAFEVLAWSFNREGEIEPGLAEQRDRRMGIDSAAKHQEREDLRSLARPQEGVDALNGKFPRPTSPVPGVVDKRSAGAAAGG
jgi:hypothetical protein